MFDVGHHSANGVVAMVFILIYSLAVELSITSSTVLALIDYVWLHMNG